MLVRVVSLSGAKLSPATLTLFQFMINAYEFDWVAKSFPPYYPTSIFTQ